MSIAESNKSPTGLDCNGTPRLPGGEYKLDGCLVGYGAGCSGGVRLPEDGHVLAPWVAVTFEGSGSLITVGNDSSPNTNPVNSAIIKSFEFGYSDGLTLRVVIHDEQGGSLVRFMEHLLKDYVCLKNGNPATVRMKTQFGWVKTGCPNPLPVVASRCIFCLVDSLETSYHEGKFVCEITGKDLCYRMPEGGTYHIYGGEGKNAIALTAAIKEYMTNSCAPNVKSVKFCRMEGGKCVPCPFKNGGVAGPKGKWIASGQDKLACTMRWLAGHPTDRKLGWVGTYNSENPSGELIFWEDSKPLGTQPDSYWDKNCIGTYIVNGGKRSSVIEFSPKIRWDFARLDNQGGQLSSTKINATGQQGSVLPGAVQSGLDAQGHPCTGQNTQATSTETHRDNFNSSETVEVIAGNSATHRALRILHDNVEADITIVGDPTILPPSEAMFSKNMTIIVVNPYFMRRNSSDTLEWLANPVCNEVLSNKGWLCKSIVHKIEAGRYTTTIGVYLTAGGVDAPPKSPLGNWTGGWVPVAGC
jgi:hypothetical protein